MTESKQESRTGFKSTSVLKTNYNDFSLWQIQGNERRLLVLACCYIIIVLVSVVLLIKRCVRV